MISSLYRLSLFFLLCISIISCTKENLVVKKPESINIFDEKDINEIVFSILNNEKSFGSDNFKHIEATKYISKNFVINSLILYTKTLGASFNELNSYLKADDWTFIAEQLNDKKQYLISSQYFRQKPLDLDSLKTENIRFSVQMHKENDSLRKIIAENENVLRKKKDVKLKAYERLKTSNPILIIDKPIFSKSKKLLIFSFSTSVGLMGTYKEKSIFEYKNGHWEKIKILSSAQESKFPY